ncbi:serine/threonine-protein kinase HipA [Microbacterium sp. W4I4]|uniref:type II toxin-antitoxin system HipA family toxin n=1 Tax=Microbacterium sp. W4I4 TaxID=3042295 RepID=UPI002783A4B4|nr:type II toxin-antitoxin system HipA family toxin [Microbacterium sp. W4I4]MDQ0614150.1 serine/threonine-protein kinase HipA [Microbacterium sp. W4I4]
MIHPDTLQVHVDVEGESLFAGRVHLHRSRGELASSTFQYESSYLAHPRAYALDPALDLVSGSQQVFAGLPGAFSDSAPDRWGRRLIAARERAAALDESRRPRALDDADFLAGVSDATRQGALRFRTDDDPVFLGAGHGVPKLLSLPRLLRASDAVSQDGDDDDFDAVKALLSAGTGSLGGARPKASVVGEDDRQLIAKFPHHEDQWDVMAWEATALDLASAAGINAARHTLTRVGGRHVLLLERFDRTHDARRIGYISAMTMLERRDGERADYVDIAEHLPEVSARASDDARELFRRAALSVGLNNTDDHLRNHGFLRHRGGWVLSPAFDINPTPEAKVRQTSVAGSDDVRTAADGLRELAVACRLSVEDADSELQRIEDALHSWRDVATGNGVKSAALLRFVDSFAAGVDAIRRARRALMGEAHS